MTVDVAGLKHSPRLPENTEDRSDSYCRGILNITKLKLQLTATMQVVTHKSSGFALQKLSRRRSAWLCSSEKVRQCCAGNWCQNDRGASHTVNAKRSKVSAITKLARLVAVNQF